MRTIPTDDQKKAILKAFRHSGVYGNLLKDYEKSFKIIEAHTDPDPKKCYYVFWSAILNRTFRVPFEELIKEES